MAPKGGSTNKKSLLEQIKLFHLLFIVGVFLFGGVTAHYVDILGVQTLRAEVDSLKTKDGPMRDTLIGQNRDAIQHNAEMVKALADSLGSFKKDYFHRREIDSILGTQRHKELLRAIGKLNNEGNP